MEKEMPDNLKKKLDDILTDHGKRCIKTYLEHNKLIKNPVEFETKSFAERIKYSKVFLLVAYRILRYGKAGINFVRTNHGGQEEI